LAVTLPFTSRVTFVDSPSFSALPRHVPSASFRSPETFEYPFASICDLAWSLVKARTVVSSVVAVGGVGAGEVWELGVVVVEHGSFGAAAE
jgi:hypothetical protein